jgi:glyoxylase-like metal-dependent hydrolase (beta-lactamase superfamily II)
MAAAGYDLIRVTDSVHVAQTPLVNWTLVVDETGVVLIDAGFPGQRDDVLASVRAVGHDVSGIRAILLTHAHIDHFGTAIWLAARYGIPVYCHSDEVAHARREYLEQASPLRVARHVWQPRWVAWVAAISRRGAFVHAGIPTAQQLTADIAATLPGHPVVVATPGHTGGHCSYLVDGVLVSGDALVTGHPTSPRPGPQLLHPVFNHDERRCLQSLSVLAETGSDIVAPGHGEVWRAPVREMAEQALARHAGR